ncbi:unnamed protein product [Linum tenue]|uniref:Uncharacterized protein n=1 Tax=Linum tenue TaxID=586396 RepID=A0AAV0S1T4_9ROSI|nr:unnamed protein product [Linum tenue]
MATSVDMSLDDIIKKNRGRGRGRGSAQRGRGTVRSFSAGRMTGKVHRGPLGVNARPSQFTISKASTIPRISCLALDISMKPNFRGSLIMLRNSIYSGSLT